jgi:hypothetical protein
VFLCLSDSEAVYDVVLGKNGLGQSLAPGAIVVDCTSGCPEAGRILSQELQQVCAVARERGALLEDVRQPTLLPFLIVVSPSLLSAPFARLLTRSR